MSKFIRYIQTYCKGKGTAIRVQALKIAGG